MAVYIFDILSGYIFGGGDVAQGYRARMLEHVSYPVKYIFTELSTRYDIIRYEKIGIKQEQMLDMHQYFTDNHTLKLCGKVEEKIEELKENLHCTGVKRLENEIWMIRDGIVVAMILLDKEYKDSYYGIHYYSYTKLIRTEVYTDGLLYVNYYVTAKFDQGVHAKLVKRTFYNKDGTVSYEIVFEMNKEWYIFPNGKIITKQQFLCEFIRKLDLKKGDIILIDRPARFDLVQPITQFKKNARLIFIMHSRHFYEKGEDPYELYLAWEYNYCFKYSELIDTVVVSTQEQKRELIETFLAYRRNVPQIAVIPAGGIERLRYPETKRQPYSLISVSRIEKRKKIEWLIKSVIKAHQINSSIFIDIYGSDDGYLKDMQNMVDRNRAQSYIRFMGWKDVTELYKNYEVYLTASLGETLGLSLMEAVASGTAMIGLDVKYGNRLFIQPGENGYLIDYDIDYLERDDEELTDAIAAKIIEIFEDEKGRLERFHQKSYEIAQNFLSEKIEEKWKNLLGY